MTLNILTFSESKWELPRDSPAASTRLFAAGKNSARDQIEKGGRE